MYLAIDQGGQSTRLAVYSETGEQRSIYSVPCSTHRSTNTNSPYEYIEQDGEEILAGILAGIKYLSAELGDDIQHIKCVGFAGQGSSLLCWNNKTGQTLSPVLSWQDIRGEPYFNEIKLNHREVQQLTGLRLSPHYGATKIRWCLEHNSDVIAARQQGCLTIGPIVSYILWHLTDKQLHVDPGHAQRTLLWNLRKNTWDEKLLDAFKIPLDVLPPCGFHNSQIGCLQVARDMQCHLPLARAIKVLHFLRAVFKQKPCRQKCLLYQHRYRRIYSTRYGKFARARGAVSKPFVDTRKFF